MATTPSNDGYPDSAPEDLVPVEPPIGLDDAELEAEEEGRADREERGASSRDERGATDDTQDEDRLADSPDVDQLAAAELGTGGARPEDAANFDDNAAEWSRERG